VTTIDAAAIVRRHGPGVYAVITMLIGALTVAGCSTDGGSSLIQQTNNAAQTLAPSDTSQTSAQTTSQGSRVTIAPVIGAPEDVAGQLAGQLATALKGKGVSVAETDGQPADFTLRGYMVAAREQAATKVSYIWDVTDPKGDRVNRITGEELISGANSRDPWASVSPSIIAQIASKTATSLGAWLPSQASVSNTPSEPNTTTAAPTPVAAKPLDATSPVQTASGRRTPAGPGAVDQTTTGSIGRPGALLVSQPSVTGAPGDGTTSLAAALSKELTGNGVVLTKGSNPSAFKVDGKVAVGASQSGKQPIQIDWTVTDPRGRNLGTVSQKNQIPAGSLNGAWGATADAAAGAAAQGIMRLLRQNTATN